MFIANFIMLVVLCVLLGWASIVDLRTRTIPNAIPLALCVLWVAWRGAEVLIAPQPGAFASGFLGALVIGGGLFLFTLAFEAITHRQGLGGGDIKLMAACALFLGVRRALLALFIACLAGIVLAFIIPKTRFAHEGEQGAMPFAPAIAVGTLVALFV